MGFTYIGEWPSVVNEGKKVQDGNVIMYFERR